MNQLTIQKLNLLNAEFYNKTAAHFDETRQHPWKGWQKLIPYLDKLLDPVKVLDIGCGNGRFGEFLLQNITQHIDYEGIDSNDMLIQRAQEKLTPFGAQITLKRQDILNTLINQSNYFNSQKQYDLIVLFGVLHHIPSHKLRTKLLQYCAHLLTEDGLLIVSTWQFDRDHQLMKRQIDPERLGISKKDREENDYLLDWQRGEQAVRYCHLVSEQEMTSLFKSTDLKLIDSFEADGKQKNLNRYYLFAHREQR